MGRTSDAIKILESGISRAEKLVSSREIDQVLVLLCANLAEGYIANADINQALIAAKKSLKKAEKLYGDESWHLKKEVNIAHLLTTIIIAFSAMSFLSGMDKRIGENALNIKHNKEEQAKELIHLSEMRKEDQDRLQRSLEGINKKLDGIDSIGRKLDKVINSK